MDDDLGPEIERLERSLVRDELAAIEHHLADDDPAFLQRFSATWRAEMATAIAVFALLATGVICLTVGLATASWPVWLAGVGAFAASFAVDEHHKHTL